MNSLTVKDIQEAIKKALLNVGLKIYKIYAIYIGMLLVLNVVIFLLMQPIAKYSYSVYEYINNNNPNIPQMQGNLYISILFIFLLTLMSRILTIGWDAACLKASRGNTNITFHDLSSMFPYFWKIVVMYIIEFVLVYIGFMLFIIPGVILLLRWSMAFYVLIEHPEYSPYKCLKQSGRIMVGEVNNLLRLGVSFFVQYIFAIAVYLVGRGFLNFFKVPPLGIGYSIFYNKLVYWKSKAKPEAKPDEQ